MSNEEQIESLTKQVRELQARVANLVSFQQVLITALVSGAQITPTIHAHCLSENQAKKLEERFLFR